MQNHQSLKSGPEKGQKNDGQIQMTNERLATIGKLTSKVAHELNNPLDGILRYINLTIRILEQENLEKPREYLLQCRQELMRMVQIVSELLEFSRRTYALMEENVQIEKIIDEALKTMDEKANAAKVQVLKNYCPHMPQIIGGNLFQVFTNLIKNAIEAMPEGGKLHITTKLAGDNMVSLEFRDTGTGFPPEKADAIFEPFFTTKGKGTGLGLAICKDIVEKYNGRITAGNSPQGGSVFTVYLPIARKAE